MTSRDWEAWKANPVTEAWFESLRERLADVRAPLLQGGIATADPVETGMNYVRALERANGLLECIEHVPGWASERS